MPCYTPPVVAFFGVLRFDYQYRARRACMHDYINKTLNDRYRIDYIIKQGGMGTVYGAHDRNLDRPCAVKAMPAGSDSELLQFKREARVLGRLCHPHLPAIFDCIEEENVVFLIMQMIPGDDLEGITARHGAPPWEVLVGWALQLAEAVQYLHHQTPPLIHRDIKPANIRLANHGQIYLVDFGIAKVLDGAATVTAAKAASVPYAPIEQVQEGSHTDQQSDIYSFGSTLYRVLTCRLPPSCIDRLVGKELPPITALNPTVPEALERLILDCMELWNTDRPAKIRDVIKRLQALRAAAHNGATNGHTIPLKAPSLEPGRRLEPKRSEPEATADGAFRAGKQALERGDATAAQTYFTHAIDLARTFAEAYAARATAHSCLGQINAAIEDWDAAIAQGPHRAVWYAERAALQRGRGDAAAAQADLTTAISLDPEVAEFYVERAAVRRDLGDGRGQLQDLDRAMTIQPDHPAARLARAHARIEQQLWKAAVSDCNALIQGTPDAAVGYFLRARVYAEMGDSARALRDVAQALAIDPQSPEGYCLRGRLLQRSGDRQAALRDYGVALSLSPDYIEVRYHRAQLYRSLRAHTEALLDFQALWRTWHGDHDPLPIPQRQLVTEINFLVQAGNDEKARRVLQMQASGFREDNEDELHERACLYERVDQLDFALDDWERLARLILNRQATPQIAVS